jgi:hypothetical protein
MIPADRRFTVSVVAWLIVVLALGVFVQRRRRRGGVIATRRRKQ